MSVIRAELANPDKIQLDVTITATLSELKALRVHIIRHKEDFKDGPYDGIKEPFWSLIYRLGDLIEKVEKHHYDYGN